MNPEQVVFYIMRLPGVAGCFIVDDEGLKKASHLPPDFGDEVIFGMATDGIDAMETFKSEIPGANELRLDIESIVILVRVLQNHLLFVFIDETAEVSAIRTGAGVCAKRYDPEGVEAASKPMSMSEILAKAAFDQEK